MGGSDCRRDAPKKNVASNRALSLSTPSCTSEPAFTASWIIAFAPSRARRSVRQGPFPSAQTPESAASGPVHRKKSFLQRIRRTELWHVKGGHSGSLRSGFEEGRRSTNNSPMRPDPEGGTTRGGNARPQALARPTACARPGLKAAHKHVVAQHFGPSQQMRTLSMSSLQKRRLGSVGSVFRTNGFGHSEVGVRKEGHRSRRMCRTQTTPLDPPRPNQRIHAPQCRESPRPQRHDGDGPHSAQYHCWHRSEPLRRDSRFELAHLVGRPNKHYVHGADPPEHFIGFQKLDELIAHDHTHHVARADQR